MQLNIAPEAFKSVILYFKNKIGELLAPQIADEHALKEREDQLNSILKDCSAYVFQQASEDISRDLSQMVTHENFYNIPGNKDFFKRLAMIQNRIDDRQFALDYLLHIVEISDPLMQGRSLADERQRWSVDQKREFLLLKLYELRKTGMRWDPKVLFSYNQVTLDDDGETLEITLDLENMGYLESIGVTGGAIAKITTSGKNYVEQHLLSSKEDIIVQNDGILDIFISHSGKDAQTARLLVDLIKAALNLHSSQIRCTSLDGYGFSGGTAIDEQLRKEVHGCKVLIGLLSENSIQSAYVLFELGARWGASKPLIPLLTDLKSKSMLAGPLKGIHAIEAFETPKLQALVLMLAGELKREAEPPFIYADKIAALAAHSNR